jgi:uncharacterized protein Yka (UPF0111/DUF47 family)
MKICTPRMRCVTVVRKSADSGRAGLAPRMLGLGHMHEKQTILEVLDRRELLLPDCVHEALEANARIKYYLSLLQMAAAHAEAPDAPPADLAGERERCGVDDEGLDAVVPRAARGLDDDAYRIPRLRDVVGRIESDLGRMIEPIGLAGGPEAAERWRERLRALHGAHAEAVERDRIAPASLAWMTSADPSRDGAHRLCLELHAELNSIEHSMADTTVDGAHAFALAPDDRALVAAFMRGVNRTAALKFGHPGLGTTATRSGTRLVLENDIGTTDAHVLVVEVEGTRAVVTSADVHVQRIAFFQRMVSRGWAGVSWDDTRSRRAPGLADDAFFVCVGRLEAADAGELARFLEHLGSRLVFLIDWNKARKTLQAFVPKAEALAALDWAAESNIGHRALLELGGDAFLYDAMAAVMRTPVRFGERLDDAIGAAAAAQFVRYALRETAEGLLEGRSRSLVRERVRAELAGAFVTAGDRLLEPARRHAAIVGELAAAVRERVAGLGAGDAEPASRRAALAKERERAADEIVEEVRFLVHRMQDAGAFESVVESADDAADAFEEALFWGTLLPPSFAPAGALADSLRRLGDLATSASDAWSACVEAARHARRGAGGPEVRALLDEVDRVVTAERDADEVERRVIEELVAWPDLDGRLFLVATRLVHHVEAATDALLHAALQLRDHATRE